jgi:hypothetical protein
MGKKSKTKRECKDISRFPPTPKSETYISSGENDLFDNPMTRAAMAALSEEEKNKYKLIGDHLYNRINFEDGQSLNNMPPSMTEAVAYLETSLQAGFHPSMFEENEKALMKETYGDEWYKEWGYVEEDLIDIVTLKPSGKCYSVNLEKKNIL